jgi:hypothetical protein
MKRPPVALTAEDVPAYVRGYGDGATLHQLAAQAGCSPKHMRETLIAAGVQMRRPGRPRKPTTQEQRP